MASFASSKSHGDQVLVEEKMFSRILTLNRPQQQNALSFQMISRLLELFLSYENDPSVKLVILKGKGRAFCAGGDIKAVARDMSTGNWKLGASYFWKGLTLIYIMATCTKHHPVSILDGTVMGGGAGFSINGRFRIATENTVFAMPETALGHFTDAGSSYFLSRLPGFLGEYVGLTGTRLDGAEMLACGLATHFVSSGKLSALEEALSKVDSSEPAMISTVIDKYSVKPCLKKQSALHRRDMIDYCFSRQTVEGILSALEMEAKERLDDWMSATIQSLKKAAPISLKITLRAIREGRLSSIGQCVVRDYRLVCHILKGEVSEDLMEGCRAILVDKDNNPKWVPPTLELVSDRMVDHYFSKMDDEEWEDFKLPVRANMTAFAMAKL